MSRLFDPENKFWNFIGKIADVTCMSFLWVGTSLPLVTMGAATTAFYSYTMHQVRDTEGGILSGYFKAFRHNFKKATLLWLLEVAGLAFFAADLVGVWNLFLFLGGLPAILVGALVLCLAFLFLGCTFYIWPLLAVFEFPLKKLLTNSFVMAVGNLPVTLTLALVWALAGVGCFYLSGVFFVWVGLAIFASSYFVDMVFKKYTGELAEEEAAWKQKQEERRQRRKQRGVVGAAASDTQARRSGCWVPQLGLVERLRRKQGGEAGAALRFFKAPPMRLPPCTPPVVSPAAYRPGMTFPCVSRTSASALIFRPPIV